MKILITGANGNLGQQLIERLCAKPLGGGAGEISVRALVRSERAAQTIRDLDCPNPPEIMVGNYTDPDSMRSAVADCSSAPTGIPTMLERPMTTALSPERLE